MAHAQGISNKRLCTYAYSDSRTCKGIALSNSNYCRHHATAVNTPSLSTTNGVQNRYAPKSETVRARMYTNLNAPNVLDLRQEIALLQAWLQELMDAPVVNFEKQLQIIDRIERLTTNFQRIRLSAQALAQAENKVKLIINNVVVIIKAVVHDKEERQEIARRLAALGQQYETEQQSAALSAVLITEPTMQEQPINSPINNAATQAQAQAQAQAGAQETGDPGVGKETEQDIPSPRAEAQPGLGT